MPPNPVVAGQVPKAAVDKRLLIGVGVMALCLGILVGFKLADGEPLVIEKPVFVEKDCVDCAERRIKAERETVDLPGDNSVPVEE